MEDFLRQYFVCKCASYLEQFKLMVAATCDVHFKFISAINLVLFYQVRFSAARATVAFILANDSENAVLNHFKDLLPFIIQVLNFCMLRCIIVL